MARVQYISHSTALNPIEAGGGHFLPGSPKIVCHFHVDSATLTKFLDFVSFDVRHVPGSKKNFEKFQNITRCQRGDPSKTETRAESAPPQPTTSFQNPAQIGLKAISFYHHPVGPQNFEIVNIIMSLKT